MSVVHIVRHGKVESSSGLAYGRLPDYHLSELGQKQARQTAEYLAARTSADPENVLLLSSPLVRALESAAPISELLNVPVKQADGAIEWSNSLEAQPYGPGRPTWLSPRGLWRMRNPLKPSWAEPYAEVSQRLDSVVQMAIRNSPVSIIVSHEIPMAVYRRYLTGEPLWHDPGKRGIALSSVLTVNFIDYQVTSIEYFNPPKIKEPVND